MAKQKPSLNQADISLLKKSFATKNDLKSFATKKDVKGIVKNELKSFATKNDLKNELEPIKKDVKRIKKDVSVMLDVFYRKDIKLKKRVSRVEEHLDLPPIPEHAFA